MPDSTKASSARKLFRLLTEYSDGHNRTDDFGSAKTAWLYATGLWNHGPLGVASMKVIEMPKGEVHPLELPQPPHA